MAAKAKTREMILENMMFIVCFAGMIYVEKIFCSLTDPILENGRWPFFMCEHNHPTQLYELRVLLS